MAKIDRLIRVAREAATWRGHDLKRFEHYERFGYPRALSQCRNCPCGVTVMTHPQPNEIDIAGDAVAVGCK